jgi:hypothetical protein
MTFFSFFFLLKVPFFSILSVPIDRRAHIFYSETMFPIRHKLLLVLALTLFFSHTQLTAKPTVRGDSLTVSLMIIGPGHPLYVWWGHIGLIIENSTDNSSYFYDFGNFSFEEDNFYGNFAMGRLYYLKIKSRTQSYLRFLNFFDRSVTIYELNLTAQEKKKVYSILEEGVKPENRIYLYHHYKDNCSTRIRDVLDEAMEGEIQECLPQYAQTFRDQANRFIKPFWPYVLLNFLQGSTIDTPITQWDALFLPQELEDFALNHVRPTGEPFVNNITKVQEGITPYIPDVPFPHSGAAFLWGMLFFFISLAVRLGKTEKLFALWRIISIIFTAIPGLFLCFMMFFTDHHVTWYNLNALVTCPLILAALIPSLVYNKKTLASRHYERFWDYQTLLTLLALLCQTLPGVNQDNGAIICLYLPLIVAQGSMGTVLIRLIKPTLRIYPWAQK